MKRIHMNTIIAAIFTVALMTNLFAVELAGYVLDYNNNPISGVKISLVNSRLSTTTGSEGRFDFSQATSVDRHKRHIVAHETKKQIDMTKVKVYDIHGRCIENNAKSKPSARGLRIAHHPKTGAMRWVAMNSRMRPHAGLVTTTRSTAVGATLRKASNANGTKDTLVLQIDGQLFRTVVDLEAGERTSPLVFNALSSSAADYSGDHPAFIRKRSEKRYVVNTYPLESICGTDDLQHVARYDNRYAPIGFDNVFVNNHQAAVGMMTTSQTANRGYCSGTLISDNRFLTASPTAWMRTHLVTRLSSIFSGMETGIS